MKNLPSIIAAIVLAAVLVLYMCSYQVRSTEVAIIKTFGEASQEPIRVREDDDSFFAGLRFKAPWPIQSVVKYDTRIRLLEDRVEETPTQDSKPIILTTFTGWTISDPYTFHRRYQTVKAGEEALRNRIRTHKKAVVGQYDFSDFVSTRPEDRKLEQIEQEMFEAVAATAQEEFGITVTMFGIKQLNLPESVTKAVFDTMKTTEENKAKNYRTEGKAEAERIVARATAAEQRILAVARRKVAEIQSQALAEVGEIYKKFRGHEELRIFLDELDALEEIMRTRTEVFFDTFTSPTNVFESTRRLKDSQAGVELPAPEMMVSPGGN
jgi:membrane protease subunit HflC